MFEEQKVATMDTDTWTHAVGHIMRMFTLYFSYSREEHGTCFADIHAFTTTHGPYSVLAEITGMGAADLEYYAGQLSLWGDILYSVENLTAVERQQKMRTWPSWTLYMKVLCPADDHWKSVMFPLPKQPIDTPAS